MRWRNTAVYLLVLLLVGGYFYYFEVVKKERKEAAEKEAKMVFPSGVEPVSAIEVTPAKQQPVRLEKREKWRIVQPVETDVDRQALDTFLGGLRKLETMRKLEKAPDNLAPFGLSDPQLKIRFEANGQWHEILVGESNPTGEARYALKGGGAEVFLIDQLAWTSLNKNLKDLRKKDVFSWQTDQAVGLEIEWQDGRKAVFQRREEGGGWTAPGMPDLKIKAEKVEDLLTNIQWLRAVDFLDESAKPNPPAVKITVMLKDGGKSELALGKPDDTARQVVASASGLSVPVKVPSNFFKDIPNSAFAFTDRSILAHPASDVAEVKWKRAGVEGSAVRTGDGKWEIRGRKLPDDLEPAVRALIDDATKIEYAEMADTAPDLTGPDASYLEFRGDGKVLASLGWPKVPVEERGMVTVRLEQDGMAINAKMQAASLRRFDEGLQELAEPIGEQKSE